jgi:hypothetical protein
MERSLINSLKARLRELDLNRFDKIVLDVLDDTNGDDITIRRNIENTQYTIQSRREHSTTLANTINEAVEIIESLIPDDSVVDSIITYRNNRTVDMFTEETNWEADDPEVPDEPDELIQQPEEPGEYRVMNVFNARGEPETRRVLVPSANTIIRTEIMDFDINDQNPNPPQRVPYYPPHHFDGVCYICFDSFNPQQDYCKVNCPAGHTFHISCINEYFNHKKNRGVTGYIHHANDFNDQCPMCQHHIDEISKIPHPLAMINKFGLRKRIFASELKYLQSLKA